MDIACYIFGDNNPFINLGTRPAYIMAATTVEKEFYLQTYEQLIERLGEEAATAKAEFYIEFLEKYPNTSCLKKSPLLKTYQSNPK